MRINCHNGPNEERRCDECAKLGRCGYDPDPTPVAYRWTNAFRPSFWRRVKFALTGKP